MCVGGGGVRDKGREKERGVCVCGEGGERQRKREREKGVCVGGVRDKGREKERGVCVCVCGGGGVERQRKRERERGEGKQREGKKKTDYNLSFRLFTSAFKRSDDSQLQSKTET